MRSRRKIALPVALAALLAASALGGGVAGAAETTAPIECEGDSCQALPPPPEEPALGTAFLTPEVNPPPHSAKPGGRAGRKHRHRHKRTPHRKQHR